MVKWRKIPEEVDSGTPLWCRASFFFVAEADEAQAVKSNKAKAESNHLRVLRTVRSGSLEAWAAAAGVRVTTGGQVRAADLSCQMSLLAVLKHRPSDSLYFLLD